MYKWTLCIPGTLDLKENLWWNQWKEKTINKHNLSNNFINITNGDSLIKLLKKHDLYNSAFEREDSIKIDEIHKEIIKEIPLDKLKKSVEKASSFLSRVKNYFEKEPTTHIERKETSNIINWIKTDLQPKKKNLLILEGDKGLGKSVILKDVYQKLNEVGYLVLGIKADKYYASNPKDLENKLFLNDNISFSSIIDTINRNNLKLVVIIDQIDALSQTLSSNREYIQTYTRIIHELLDEENIRIIISSRTYDLKYDAELSIYTSNEYKNIKATLLSEDEVTKTLQVFNVRCSSKKVIQLLRTPNHLEIFCKLPNKERININALSSLKDLYDKLWETLILNKKELALEKALYSIALEMYHNQQIVVRKQFVSKYNPEINYLLSNQLLITDESNIQFFHQTFYDYCFARQFVENENDIYNYLFKNQQNLEIRSIVKMVFEYLREYDPKRYIKYSKSILKSSKYRFHLKLLIINNLGFFEPSNEEKLLVQKQILKNNLYEEIFINSISSEKWIEHLIENRIIDNYLFVKKSFKNYCYDWYKKQSFFKSKYLENLNIDKITENKRHSIWILLSNNINKSPYLITSYLDQLPDFTNKHDFIERLLYNLDHWEDEKMLSFFEKYITYDAKGKRRDNFWFYQIIIKIFYYHKDYALSKIKTVLDDIFINNGNRFSKEFSHDQKKLLNDLYKLSPEDIFNIIFQIYNDILINNPCTISIKETNSLYYSCSLFFDNIGHYSQSAHEFIEEFLVNHLITKKDNIDYILNFYNTYKNSNSIYIIRIFVLLFLESPRLYTRQAFELITLVSSKNGFNSTDDLLQLKFRLLIGQIFPHLSSNQKNEIINIILEVKNPYEQPYSYEDNEKRKRVAYPGVGKKQYAFIKVLPKEEIEKSFILKKKNNELRRRFGDINENKASDVSSMSSYTVGAPLEHNVYSKMNLDSWKSSFFKFDDNYIEGHGPKGGKREHSSAFETQVEENPNQFYNFILNLFDDDKVSVDYISSGLNGLIKAEFDPNKVKIIYKKLIKLELDRSNTLYSIWKAEYLIKHHIVDAEIVQFLSHNALNHPSPSKPMNENDPHFDSLNTVRGAAIHKLIQCYEHKEFSEIIFETVEKAVNDPQISVKIAIIQELAYLNHLDLKRSFKIFQSLIEKDDIQILKNSFRTSQYFNTKFHHQMQPYFDKIIKYEELHEDGNVIVFSWLNDKINNKVLYEKFIKSSDKAKLCALNIAEENLFDRDDNSIVNEKSLSIINSFLNKSGDEFTHAYSGLILRKIKPIKFKLLYDFLFKYSKSEICMDEPRYFLQLLLGCVKEHPKKCLKLLQNMNFSNRPDIQKSGYYDKEPVQLILAIYSKLNMDAKNNKKHIKIALDIFDSMLKLNHLRTTANDAIELAIKS